MAEELSPESKLYVKEEIEKARKEFKEEVEKVKSRTTRILSTVVIVVGLLTTLGVRHLAIKYMESINETINRKLNADTLVEIEKDIKKLSDLKTELKSHQLAEKEGYAWIGNIALIWGTRTSTLDRAEPFFIGWDHFPNDCFTVITSLAGEVKIMDDNKKFTFSRLEGYTGPHEFTYVAIGY